MSQSSCNGACSWTSMANNISDNTSFRLINESAQIRSKGLENYLYPLCNVLNGIRSFKDVSLFLRRLFSVLSVKSNYPQSSFCTSKPFSLPDKQEVDRCKLTGERHCLLCHYLHLSLSGHCQLELSQ